MIKNIAEQCRACITNLKTIILTISDPDKKKGRTQSHQVNDELERFSLWMGNIGAPNPPESSMSLEYRLREAQDVQSHIQELLDDLNEIAQELLSIVSGEREGETAPPPDDDSREEGGQTEEMELLEGFGLSVTRLFRVSKLIRQSAPTDLFAKALSRDRFRFNDQFDIAHVGEKFPKLATEGLGWLRKRLGRAITQRRHYLSYVQDHHDRLGGLLPYKRNLEPGAVREHDIVDQTTTMKPIPDHSSRPSTFFTKASTLSPGLVMPQSLATEEEPDSGDDVKSYTTISRSVDGDLDLSATVKIPKLGELRTESRKEFECPFCFRMKKFKNERVWKQHVFSDLRSYICTFPECDAPYFSDINEWFRHEMQNHRVNYSCRLCHSKTILSRQRYLDHIWKQHPTALKDGNEELILSIAREPVEQIAAQDCPCCLEWIDRLKTRTTLTVPSDEIYVTPAVFKRHVASHLEQLASFAIPIPSTAEGDGNSNAAIEDELHVSSRASDLSALVFDSSPEPSLKSKTSSSGRIDTLEQMAIDDDLRPSKPVSFADLHSPTFRSSKVTSLADIDPDTAPHHLKIKPPNGDWYAVFNPDVPRVLDIEMVHQVDHSSVVCCVKFSFDGKYLATGSKQLATLFDAHTGQKLGDFQADDGLSMEGDDNYVRSISFSPDSKYLATASEDKLIKIWEIETKTILHLLKGHTSDIYSIDYSPDGLHIASGGADKTVRLWDAISGQQTSQYGIKDGVTSVAISPDGRYLAAGSLDTNIYIWLMNGELPVRIYEGHLYSVCSVIFSPDGQQVLSASADKTIKIWKLSVDVSFLSVEKSTSKDYIRTLKGHKGPVYSLCITQRGEWIISGDDDGCIHVQFWDPQTGVAQMLLKGHLDAVVSVSASPTNSLFASASLDGILMIWRYKQYVGKS